MQPETANICKWPTHRRQTAMLGELIKHTAGSFSPVSPMRQDWLTMLQAISNFVTLTRSSQDGSMQNSAGCGKSRDDDR